ncbi:Arc family DNA-binding protein [Sphingomonas sp. NPDC019816]|uniref:Arc family DNA-binding protein n=1 Tax=Sphingomonas sp. NPDC019816 TaxID=3390679 RepID=UPI003CFBF4A6
MSDESDFSYFRVRLPNDLKALIEEASYASKRSMNAEVISRLEASFAQDQESADDKETIAEHEERIRELEFDMRRILDRIEHEIRG